MPKVAKFSNINNLKLSTKHTDTGIVATISFDFKAIPAELSKLLQHQDSPLDIQIETAQLRAFNEPLPDERSK